MLKGWVKILGFLDDSTDGKKSRKEDKKPAPVAHTEINIQTKKASPSKVQEEIIMKEEKVFVEAELLTGRPPIFQEEIVKPEPEPRKIAVAKYTFKAESENELGFRKGDFIDIINQIDDHWFEGALNGVVGIFPVAYVQTLDDPQPKDKVDGKKKGAVTEDVVAPKKQILTESDHGFDKIFQDALNVKDLHHSYKSNDNYDNKHESYSSPKIEQNGHKPHDGKVSSSDSKQNGYHDDDYTKEMNAKNTQQNKKTNDIDNLIGMGDSYKAVYSYNRTNDDEIDLQVGDIVYVLEQCDDGWFVGTCERTGAFGTFPGNYVNGC